MQTAAASEQRGAVLSAAAIGELRRISAWLDGHVRTQEAVLDDALDQGGFGPGRRSDLRDSADGLVLPA